MTISGDTRAMGSTEASRATHMSFAYPVINANSATPTKSNSTKEIGVMTPVSFFVPVLLAILLQLVLLSRLTRLVGLVGLVGLTILPRAQGV